MFAYIRCLALLFQVFFSLLSRFSAQYPYTKSFSFFLHSADDWFSTPSLQVFVNFGVSINSLVLTGLLSVFNESFCS